jgi:hypothetical protein
MITSGDGQFHWARPTATAVTAPVITHQPDARLAIVAAVEVDRALSSPGDRPLPPSAQAVARLEELESVALPAASAFVATLDGVCVGARRERAAQQERYTRVVERYREIDETIARSVAAVLARRRSLHSPERLEQDERHRLVSELGFADCAAYERFRDSAIDEEDRLVGAARARLQRAEEELLVAHNKVHGPLHAEIELLAFHIRFETHLDVTRAISQRDRNLTRRLLRSPLATVLRAMAIDPGDDAVEAGRRWLAST